MNKLIQRIRDYFKTSNKESSSNRILGLREMIKSGLGGTVGGPIFVILGTAIYHAKGGLLIALALNGLLMLLFVLNYSELALSLPIAGGGYSFSKEAIGGIYGFLIGWLIWVGNLVFAALSGLGFAYSIQLFLPSQFLSPQWIPWIAAIIVSFYLIISIRTPHFTVQLMRIFMYALVGGFLVFIFAGLFLGPFVNYSNYSVNGLKEMPSLTELFAMTAFTFPFFCLYETQSAFEGLTKNMDRLKRPRENAPKGFMYSIMIAVFIYFFVSLTTLVNIGKSGSDLWNLITSSSSPLADLFNVLFGSVGMIFMGIVGMIATMTSISSGLQMSSHVLQSMARDGFTLPQIQEEKNGVPRSAMLISGVLTIGITLFSNIQLITALTSLIYLVSMGFLSFSVISLRKSRPNLNRPWLVPGYPYTPIISILAVIFLLFSIPIEVIFIGIVILLFGILYYLIYIARRDRTLLLLYGMKLGSGFLILLFMGIIKIQIITLNNISLNRIVVFWIVFGFIGLFAELYPPRRWAVLFLKDKADLVVVGGIIHLPTKIETKIRKIVLIYGSLLVFGGLFLGIIMISIGRDWITINTNHPFFTSEIARLIFLIIGTSFTLILLLNGLVTILQEYELIKEFKQ